ncbi:MAG: thioredoxin domain-containing protein [Candidatus Thermoplasmatota archaeon]|nr:thioredoxin domain-containing protein [Candidatus Thermoplasmatota archaeon]
MDRHVPPILCVFGSTLIHLQSNLQDVTRGTFGAEMKVDTVVSRVAWRDWSREAFDEARNRGKLVLLDLSADWCHWCHVMDRTTYSDPDVVETINSEFVPVRVDIDARPDISERYNRGGFPTTAFLSDQGESLWGATYVPPNDMKRIMAGILSANASGEIADALARSRKMGDNAPRPTEPRAPIDADAVDAVFEDIFSTYDVEHGGFGLYPKFPHPEVLEVLLLRYLTTGDEEASKAVQHTIARMTDGLYDKVEGGVFRYSVTRDWREPHYEKMLETNAAFLRNLTAAYKVFGSPEYEQTASGIAGYLLNKLLDRETGGFHGSQDADEEYYKLSADMRARRKEPKVVRAVYGGWNAEAVSALVEAGTVFRNRAWLDAATRAWNYASSRLWSEDMELIRHEEEKELYLFEDQVSFLDALLSMYSLTGRADLMELGHGLVSGIERHFSHPYGGYADILNQRDAVGVLGERRRSLAANSKYARLLALFSVAAHDQQIAERPSRILGSFSREELEANGLFAAESLIAWHVLEEGAKMVSVGIEGDAEVFSNDLWMAAKSVHNPAVLCAADTGARHSRKGAVVCTGTGCSDMISSPQGLAQRLGVSRANQV